MNDYDRIARVLRYLDQHHADQPNLAALASHLGLSQFHFHRLFSAWAGITPKDFLQCLSLAHVRSLLANGENVLDAALAAGLSGPGRLHDLCVGLEAASPGELKSGGEGWKILLGFVETPFGRCLLAEGPRGICHLSFPEATRPEALGELRRAWPNAALSRDDEALGRRAAEIFRRPEPAARRPRLRAFVKGSAFQVRVWTALLRVPAGAVVTYGALAAAVGQPSAARAVGGAVGDNPLAYLIPCHRVIRETGALGGYRWGTARKQAMLAWETARKGTPEALRHG